MKLAIFQTTCLAMVMAAATTTAAAPEPETAFDWHTVVNNNDLMPPLAVRNFNSYNQPSVNADGLVVMRARSRGGPPLGPPTHGIYVRDMANHDSQVVMILDKTTHVPQPNNLDTTFVETPSFPRIDIHSSTIATRGNHAPVHRYHLGDGSETRAGTTGIYTNPFGNLITGAAKLGQVPDYSYFGVPEFSNLTFEVFPGAPSVANGDTIVFKGNYTAAGASKTGVYFRQLANEPGGGTSPAVMIANNTDTLIPGTLTVFGSTAPPNAAGNHVVFAGFDNEDAPTLGGIYMAPLTYQPPLSTLVSIGGPVPGESEENTFKALGEGIAFDGRFVGFWGAWGDETKTLRIYCAEEGNRDRIAYCNQELVCRGSGETLGDPNSICDDASDPEFGKRCYVEREIPVNQGIFVHDSRRQLTHKVASTGEDFDDFLFWNYSGKAPCSGRGHQEEGGEDDGEQVRWRSSAFVAVATRGGASFNAVFKARTNELIDGIYLKKGPGRSPLMTVLDTTTEGQVVDPEAPEDSTVIELGVEREGLRGDWLAINASMGTEGGEEEDGIAGVYITKIRR